MVDLDETDAKVSMGCMLRKDMIRVIVCRAIYMSSGLGVKNTPGSNDNLRERNGTSAEQHPSTVFSALL